MDKDLGLMIRVTHALLASLPKQIDAPDGTRVTFIRCDDPDELGNPEDAELMVSPLYVDKETMTPQILVTFKRGDAECLFALQQVGILCTALAAVCPEVPSPFDNPA